MRKMPKIEITGAQNEVALRRLHFIIERVMFSGSYFCSDFSIIYTDTLTMYANKSE